MLLKIVMYINCQESLAKYQPNSQYLKYLEPLYQFTGVSMVLVMLCYFKNNPSGKSSKPDMGFDRYVNRVNDIIIFQSVSQ